ncbi:unnamed protein product [Strongylus vulgaris]|uniref:Uncharacterized protein n=1 Tax=Strongylus vulgaris TaxID=40348 RepID=A0A3P7HYT2_STRVU|nr:unnamed protein product [Strongylus vulgaris]
MRISGCQRRGSIGSGDPDQGNGMRMVTVLLNSYLPHTFFTPSLYRKNTSGGQGSPNGTIHAKIDNPQQKWRLLDVSVYHPPGLDCIVFGQCESAESEKEVGHLVTGGRKAYMTASDFRGS